MNLAIIAPGFSRNESHFAIPVLQNLVVALAKKHQVTVFTLRYPEQGEYEFAGIRHIAIGGGTKFGLRSLGVMQATLKAITQAHEAAPFDLIHAFWIDEPGFVAVNAGRKLNLPVVASIGGGELVWLPEINYGTQGSWFRRWLVNQTLRRADVITGGSEYVLGLAGKGELVPLGVEIKQLAVSSKKVAVLVQAGSLSGVKNQKLLLQVFQMALGEMPALRLCLIGDGPLRTELEAEAIKLDVGDKIKWQGKVGFREMPALFQQSQLYLQTSLHESQGMAVLEAMAYGVPAIGTPVGVMPEVAAMPATWSPEALAAQVVVLLSDEVLYADKCRQARQVVAERYSLVKCRQRFEAIYQRF